MIGVIANQSDHPVVREFFELFKTPWEFYQSDRNYEVLLCSGDSKFQETDAKMVLIYAGRSLPFDSENKTGIAFQRKEDRVLSYNGARMPLYGDSATFRGKGNDILVDEESRDSALYVNRSSGGMLARVGYDLFLEIRALLTVGQPAANASIPTLELHVALLRDLILAGGVPVVEIPPVPAGYQLIASLTHDVDHPSIRQHKFDHTMFGFLYRAILGSLINLFRGRASVHSVLTNWAAVLRLPFIHLGLAKDFWYEFDRYIKLEKGLHSTFFVIPFEGDPGRNLLGMAPKRRASLYGATDIADRLGRLVSAGCEIGVHGIDAWLDSSKGHEELEQIRSATGMQDVGVRMHWLYFDEESPAILERAGADYDSTIGFNETVGYRAGTTQAYKPLQATRLLELPLHIMDTALFFPCYLNLSPREAREQVGRIVENAVQLGGCVTVNWHDRSIAPERLWGDFYVDLIDELKDKRAWFSTAAQAVSWFRKRRSAVFESVDWEAGAVRVKIAVDVSGDLPDLQLRIYNGAESQRSSPVGAVATNCTRDLRLRHTIDACVALS
jgi:hypothetical protein